MGRFLDAGNSEFWMSEEYKLASNSEKGLVIPSIRNKHISNRNKEGFLTIIRPKQVLLTIS